MFFLTKTPHLDDASATRKVDETRGYFRLSREARPPNSTNQSSERAAVASPAGGNVKPLSRQGQVRVGLDALSGFVKIKKDNMNE